MYWRIFMILSILMRKEASDNNIYFPRYLAASADYFAAAGYRTALAGTYYPSEYHAALGNGYLDAASSRIPALASYDQVGTRAVNVSQCPEKAPLGSFKLVCKCQGPLWALCLLNCIQLG